MLGAFRSEWLKIRRPSVLIGAAAMSAFGTLFTYLAVYRATSAPGRFVPGGQPSIGAIALASSDGLTTLLSRGATMIDVIAFVLVSAAMASEFSQGTLRNLLVFQPGRLRLLGGKFLALLLFVVLAATVALALSSTVATLTARWRGVETSAWTSSTGLGNLGVVYGDLLIALLAWSVFAFFGALVFRSAAGAIGSGMAYLLVIEGLISAVWDDAPRWLFGRLVESGIIGGQHVLTGPEGANASGYGRSLVLVGLYVAAFAVAGAVLFRRRDVST